MYNSIYWLIFNIIDDYLNAICQYSYQYEIIFEGI